MTSLPSIGAPVSLRDADGGAYPSRLEGYDDAVITVARPSGLLASVAYQDGMSFDLTWTMETGVYVLPVTLVGTSTDGLVRLWHLEANGDIWAQQRRDYVRVPLSGLIRMTPRPVDARPTTPSAEGVDTCSPFEGGLLDVSEVAARCVVPLGVDDPRATVGMRLQCRFTIGDDDFDIIGVVVIVRAGDSSNESRIVVRFEHSEAAASALRRHVFRIQLELRRERQQSQPGR